MSNENQQDINPLPEEWVNEYLSNSGISYDYKTDGYRQGSQVIEPKILMAKLRLQANKDGLQGFRPLLVDSLMLWRYEQQFSVLQGYRNQLEGHHDPDDISNWVKAATGDNSPLDIAVVKHFVWQVKRKLFGLPVDHHIMPILFGKSGGGKSVAIHKLVEPLKELTLETNMSVFQDRFGMRQFSRNYIMFFDELSGASNVDVNRLKQVITAPVMEWRVMHSEGVNSAPQNCTFIGCTNTHVSERIKDPTSARRFWQLTCADKLDWENINSIDYSSLWRSVDHYCQSPILHHLAEIKEVQEREIRAKSLTEQWLEQCCKPTDFNSSSPTSKTLYQNFQQWAQWQKLQQNYTFQQFSKELPQSIATLGIPIKSKHSNRGTIWSVELQSE